ncbi:MAG: PASTA domain-containing protein [Thermoleophilia bacterium]
MGYVRNSSAPLRRAVVASLLGLPLVAGCGGGGSRTTVTVPRLAGLTVDQAVNRICAAGLHMGRVIEEHTDVPVRRMSPRGQVPAVRVVGSSPAAGRVVSGGSAVGVRLRLPRNESIAVLVPTACGASPR